MPIETGQPDETKPLPELATLSLRINDEISLRPLTHGDVDAVFAAVKRNEDHLMRFMHWMTPDYSLDSAREFIERNTAAIEKKESLNFGIFRGERLIGSIGYVYLDTRSRKTEIGYWIDHREEGKGIVSTATQQLIATAFETFGFNRVEIRCSVRNLRSAAIPQRLGFKQEAHLRQAEMRDGELHDFFIFGLLRSEWSSPA